MSNISLMRFGAELARRADAVYGPAITPTYLHKEATDKVDSERARAIASISDNLDGCSLLHHQIVVAARAKVEAKKQKKCLARIEREALVLAIAWRIYGNLDA